MKTIPRIIFAGGIILAGLVIILWARSRYIPDTRIDLIDLNDSAVVVIHKIPKRLYGIPSDSFKIQNKKIRKNQFLADILRELSVPGNVAEQLIEQSDGILNPRKIRSGDPYSVFYRVDTLRENPEYFVIETSNIDFVVFRLRKPYEVFRDRKKLDTLQQAVSGVISRSLWETMVTSNASPELAYRLSEIFAWEVDFYRIQEGDRFTVFYDMIFIDDEPSFIGRIHAAYMNHFGKDYYGFGFEQDGRLKYFDEQGQSLEKQLLKAPLQFRRISSRYTNRRYHPVQKRYKSHLGTDYAAPEGTPIVTVGDGIVSETGYSNYNGRYLKIRHNSIYTTQYLHLSGFARAIKKGVQVKQGQVIGYVGSTGLATGPHLCYRFWVNGRQVDPLKVDIPSSEPVQVNLMNDYENIMANWKPKLDSLQYINVTSATIESKNQ